MLRTELKKIYLRDLVYHKNILNTHCVLKPSV